jgi:hypothetical protein
MEGISLIIIKKFYKSLNIRQKRKKTTKSRKIKAAIIIRILI